MKYNLRRFDTWEDLFHEADQDVYLIVVKDFILWYHYAQDKSVTNCFCFREQEDGTFRPSMNESYAKITSVLGNPQLVARPFKKVLQDAKENT